MLTAEKAHLLLTRDSGRPEAPSLHATALAAASLADLRRAGVVRSHHLSGRDPQRARRTTPCPALAAEAQQKVDRSERSTFCFATKI